MDSRGPICEKAKLQAQVSGGGPDVTLFPQQKRPGRAFCYRNFGLFPTNLSKKKRVDFSGPSRWTVTVSMSALSDPRVTVVGWKPQLRLIEVVTDRGVKLEAAPPEPAPAFRRQETEEPPPAEGTVNTLILQLQLPEGAGEKIARARFAATALFAREMREYKVTPAQGKAEDGDFEVTLLETKVTEEIPYPCTTVLVRPKRLGVAELSALPLQFRPRYKESGESSMRVVRKDKENAVEFEVWSYPLNAFARQPGPPTVTLEAMKVSIPIGIAERPIYAELTDLPLK